MKIENSVSKPKKRPWVKTLDNQYISLSASEVPQVSKSSETEDSEAVGQSEIQRSTHTEIAVRKNPISKIEIAHHFDRITRQDLYLMHIEDHLKRDQKELKRIAQEKNTFKAEAPVQAEHDAQLENMTVRSIPSVQCAPQPKSHKRKSPEFCPFVESSETDFQCIPHPLEWHDLMTEIDLKSNVSSVQFTMEEKLLFLEPKATCTNEDNIFHCLFGEKEPFRCENPAEKRAQLITFLQKFVSGKDRYEPAKPFLLHFLSDGRGRTKTSDHLNRCYENFTSREASKEEMLTEVMVRKSLPNAWMNSAQSSSKEETVLKFVEDCECATTLKAIANFLGDQNISGDGELLLSQYLIYLENPWQRLRLSDLPLMSMVFKLKIVVYKETERREAGKRTLEEMVNFKVSSKEELAATWPEISILMKSDGTFLRLEKNPKLLKFYELQSLQSHYYRQILR